MSRSITVSPIGSSDYEFYTEPELRVELPRVATPQATLTQVGKQCHKHCAIYHKMGDCIMPREGVFCKVIKGGRVCAGDSFDIIGEAPAACSYDPYDILASRPKTSSAVA